MKNKVLIIGGTGFIGYHLAKFLIKKKFKVFSLSTTKPKKKRKINKVNYIIDNIIKLRNIKQFRNEFNYVINLGGYVDHSNRRLTYLSHYKGSINLFNEFKNSKIECFIQVGSSLEYGCLKSPQKENQQSIPRSIYARSKLLATNFLLKKFKKNKFPVIILRAYQIYGPKQDNNRLISFVISNCLKNKKFYCSEGNQLRDFLYIDDFINAIYKSLNNRKALGQIINIGYGKPKKVKDVILKIKNQINKGKPLFNKIKLRSDEMDVLYPSIKKAKKILNWKPKLSFKKGLNKTINDFKRR